MRQFVRQHTPYHLDEAMTPYSELFPAGSPVQVGRHGELVEFSRTWKGHHPLSEQQLACAGCRTTVKAVGFYHGGDVLYELADLPGTWHEACLRHPST